MLIEHVRQSLLNSENLRSKLDQELVDFTGMTSPKIKHFLNNICSMDDVRYLEIGLGTGSTHVAALSKNEHVKSWSADLWLEKKVGDKGKERFEEVYDYFLGDMRTKIFNGDCFTIDLKDFFGDEKINIYLYDGGHEIDDHFKALEYFLPVLDKQFIFLVDDWNDYRVQNGTNKALNELPIKVLHREQLGGALNTTPGVWGDIRTTEGKNVGYWNGLLVLVLEKK